MTIENVTCNIQGGLGNQLFQIATTLAYAWDHNKTTIFLKEKSSPSVFNKRPVYWNSLLQNVPTTDSLPTDSYTPIAENSFLYSPLENSPGHVLLKGYFQSPKYFDHYRQQIKQTFKFPSHIVQSMHEKHSDILSLENSVAIHVRRGDYLKLKHFHTVLSTTPYYQHALLHFNTPATFIIFSDDIDWCKQKFPAISTPRPYRYFKSAVKRYHNARQWFYVHESDIAELYLMSQCKHHIIANSSFSWWGAYLSNQTGKVVAPSRWFGKKSQIDSVDDIYFSDWFII